MENSQENSNRKTLTIIAKRGFEDSFPFSLKPSSKQSVTEDTIKLTFEGTDFEINQLFSEINTAMKVQPPSMREVSVMADEKGILYDERPNLNGIAEFHHCATWRNPYDGKMFENIA